MNIGNKFLNINRVENVIFNDFELMIQVYFDRTKMLLERYNDKTEYNNIKNNIKNELKKYKIFIQS